MAINIEPLVFDSFKGIREYNGVNSGGQISAIECKNVDLVQTEIGSATGIKSMSGRSTIFTLPDAGYSIIGNFVSEQDDITYEFVYAESDLQGRLYVSIDSAALVAVSGLENITKSPNGECNGITISSTAYDEFIFTNGINAYSISFARNPIVKAITTSANPAKDRYNNDIHFIAMCEWNGYLVVATEYGVRGSHQNDIYTWNDNSNLTAASSWDINYTEKVTALYAYTGGLFIFTQNNTDFLNASPNVSGSSKLMVAGVGCFSFSSIVKHDTYLFFYDNVQKNIYYIENIDNGQTRPAGPAAREIQSIFNDVKSFKMYSCIYNNKNEIWCIINDSNNEQRVFIYNYVLTEWIERDEADISSLCLIKNSIHVTSGNEVNKEFLNENYNTGGKKSVYQTCFINIGSNTNIKKQKTPLLLVLNDQYINDFWIQLTINNKVKNPKHIKIKRGFGGEYTSYNESEIYKPEQCYGTAIYVAINKYAQTVVEISTPQTWYTMSIKIYTQTEGQGFYIRSMELKNIKMKTKTRGR